MMPAGSSLSFRMDYVLQPGDIQFLHNQFVPSTGTLR